MSHEPVYTDGTLGTEGGREGGKQERGGRETGGRAKLAKFCEQSAVCGRVQIPLQSLCCIALSVRWTHLQMSKLRHGETVESQTADKCQRRGLHPRQPGWAPESPLRREGRAVSCSLHSPAQQTVLDRLLGAWHRVLGVGGQQAKPWPL